MTMADNEDSIADEIILKVSKEIAVKFIVTNVPSLILGSKKDIRMLAFAVNQSIFQSKVFNILIVFFFIMKNGVS